MNRVAEPSSPNAFRKFAEVTNLLYYSREFGTYTGDVDTFPDSEAHSASARSGRVGRGWRVPYRVGESCAQLEAGGASAPRTQTSRAARSDPAGAHLPCGGRRRHVGRALLRAVLGTARGQFVVRSAPSAALGGVCRPDAPGPAPDRDAPTRAGRVLARVACPGPRWHPIQRDEHAPSQCDDHESGVAARTGGLRETGRRRLARGRRAQSAGGRDCTPRRIRIGVGAPAVRTTAEGRAAAGRSLVWRAGSHGRRLGGVSTRWQSLPLPGT